MKIHDTVCFEPNHEVIFSHSLEISGSQDMAVFSSWKTSEETLPAGRVGIGKVYCYQFQAHMEEGACVSGYFFKGPIADKFYFALSMSWFVIGYALPCACFFILYGMVAISMQRRKRDSQFESNRYENFAWMGKSTLHLDLQKRICTISVKCAKCSIPSTLC